MKRALATVILGAALLVGCRPTTTKPATLVPGAADQADQAIYDSLMVAQASLNSLKTSAKTNAVLKPYVDQAIKDYNVAEAAWQTYHTAVSVNPSVSPTAAQAALNKVQADLSAAPKVN